MDDQFKDYLLSLLEFPPDLRIVICVKDGNLQSLVLAVVGCQHKNIRVFTAGDNIRGVNADIVVSYGIDVVDDIMVDFVWPFWCICEGKLFLTLDDAQFNAVHSFCSSKTTHSFTLSCIRNGLTTTISKVNKT